MMWLYLTSSMRELLEKAHQQDEEELFAEEEGDEEFAAPGAFPYISMVS